MTEKEIHYKFTGEWHDNLSKVMNTDKLRLYAMELPIRTEDGEKRADLVYEVEDENNTTPMANKMFVIEVKKGNIDTGVVEQVLRYSEFAQKQLYRHKKVSSFIAGKSFSNWEIEMCKRNKVFALQYDDKGNMKIL